MPGHRRCCCGECVVSSVAFDGSDSLDGFTQSPASSFSWSTDHVETSTNDALAIDDTTLTASPFTMSAAVRFKASGTSAEVRVWVARDVSGNNGLFAKLAMNSSCATLTLWEKIGGTESQLPNTWSVDIPLGSWHEILVCWRGAANDRSLTATIDTAAGKSYGASDFVSDSFTPGAYAAFGAGTLSSASIDFDDWQLSDASVSRCACTRSCELGSLPYSLDCTVDEASGSWSDGPIGNGILYLETLVEDVYSAAGATLTFAAGKTVSILYDKQGGSPKKLEIARHATNLDEFDVTLEGTTSNHAPGSGEISYFTVVLCRYPSAVAVNIIAVYELPGGSLAVNRQESSIRPSGAIQYGVESDDAAAEFIFSVTKHAAVDPDCGSCSNCDTCDGDNPLPDVLFLTVGSGLTNDECDRCDEFETTFPLSNSASNPCEWRYAEVGICDTDLICQLDPGCGDTYNLSITLTLESNGAGSWRWFLQFRFTAPSDPGCTVSCILGQVTCTRVTDWFSDADECSSFPTTIDQEDGFWSAFDDVTQVCGGSCPTTYTLTD